MMKLRNKTKALLGAFAALALLGGARADDAAPAAGGDSYLDAMNAMGGNPADFAVDDGHDLWKKKAGPKNASLEQCDLGLGAGVVKGAYAQLPRYFADTGRVQDLESRLVTCEQTLQGIDAAAAKKDALKNFDGTPSPLEEIAIYVAKQSDGMKLAIPQNTAEEKAAYDNGKKLFFYRAGPYNFSCAACHGQSDKHIRVSHLVNLTNAEAASSYPTWPAYPNTQGVARTMEWRMNDCYRQQRFPAPKFTADSVVDLIEYMGVNSNGATLHTPSFKR
jgi:sulfur-oxidizing protein SoxA